MEEKVNKLLKCPLWRMTGDDLVVLLPHALRNENPGSVGQVVKVTGIHALANHIACSDSTVYMLRREDVLDDAVISKIGKRIVFDAEKARQLAVTYKKEKWSPVRKRREYKTRV